VDASVRQTGTGKNKIVVRFEVTSGPSAGRAVFNDFVLTPGNPNAMVMFFRQMKNLGLDQAYFSRNPSLQQVAQDLTGRAQRLRLGIRNWQGVDRNSVLQITPLDGPQANVGPGMMAPPMPIPAGNPREISTDRAMPPLPNLVAQGIPEEPKFTVPPVQPAPVVSEPAEQKPVIAPPPSMPF
jgi:hypothetical protein